MEAVFLSQLNVSLEEVAETRRGEKLGLGAVGDDAASFHHEDAIDFGWDVGDVMGDEEDASSLLGETAEEVAQVGLRGEIEGIGGLVEEKHLGGRDEGAANHDATLLASGHFPNRFVGELGSVDLMENFVGAGAHGVGDGEIGPEGGAGEEAGEDGVAAGGGEGGAAGEFGGDYTEAFFELG